jgi:hypothetical protein
MFLKTGQDEPAMEGESALWIDGRAIWLFDESVHPYPLNDPFAAIGSGAMAALAAMHLGSNPRQAVKVAAKVDPSTGGSVHWMGVKR